MMVKLLGWVKQVCLLGIFSMLMPSVMAFVPATAPNYVQDALVEGKYVQRWNDSTQVIQVTVQSGKGLPGWKPEMLDTLKAAFAEWQKALHGRLRFAYTSDLTLTDITVKWQLRSNGQKIGTSMTRADNNTLSDADINMSLRDPKGHAFNNADLYVTVLHEIGHALGIRGHSGSRNDVMYAEKQSNLHHLSARDIATIQALYKLKPVITNPVGVHLVQFRMYQYYVRMALSASNAGNHASAYELFLKAQSYYPKDTRNALYLGMSAYNIKKFDVAVANLQKALAQGGTVQQTTPAEYYLANALMAMAEQESKTHHTAQASQHYTQALQHFTKVAKNAKAPADLRKMATEHLAKLNTTSKKST